MAAKKQRIIEYDFLRVSAIIAVVAIHCYSYIIGSDFSPTSKTWIGANLVDSLARWCVPIFIMLSGALLIRPTDKLTNIREFYKSKSFRIVVPLLVWTLIYLVWYARFQSPLPLWEDVLFATERFIKGNPIPGHLYYLLITLGLYAITPFINVLIGRLTARRLSLIVFALLAVASISHAIDIWVTTGSSTNFLNRFIPYIGYYLMGYLFHLERQRIKLIFRLRWLAASWLGIAITMTFVAVALKSADNSHYAYLYGYLSPATICLSLTSFVLLMKLSDLIEPIFARTSSINYVTLLSKLSGLTFGVYLCHRLLIYGLWHLFPQIKTFINPIVGSAITLLIVLIGSFAAAYLYGRVVQLFGSPGRVPSFFLYAFSRQRNYKDS